MPRTEAVRYTRLRLLAIERVHFTTSQHVRENEVLQDLDTLWRPSLVVVLEGVEEVLRRSCPLAFSRELTFSS